MQLITSASNEKIKKMALYASKASARKEDGIFLAEGTKLVTEAPAHLIREIYVSESCLASLEAEETSVSVSFRSICGDLPEDAVIRLPDRLFEKISTMKTPQGMIVVLDKLSYSEEDLTKGGDPLLVVLEDVQDPGNVGTVFRTAEAAGVTGIILSEGCADPLSPKVVRSAMGALFRVPFIVRKDIPEEVKRLESEGIACFAARLDGASEYDKCDLASPCALLIGNEGNGLSEETRSAASDGIFIPMCGKTESLNAAVSASILMYEASRQRRNR